METSRFRFFVLFILKSFLFVYEHFIKQIKNLIKSGKVVLSSISKEFLFEHFCECRECGTLARFYFQQKQKELSWQKQKKEVWRSKTILQPIMKIGSRFLLNTEYTFMCSCLPSEKWLKIEIIYLRLDALKFTFNLFYKMAYFR